MFVLHTKSISIVLSRNTWELCSLFTLFVYGFLHGGEAYTRHMLPLQHPLDLLSGVYFGTATPRDQGPGII